MTTGERGGGGKKERERQGNRERKREKVKEGTVVVARRNSPFCFRAPLRGAVNETDTLHHRFFSLFFLPARARAVYADPRRRARSLQSGEHNRPRFVINPATTTVTTYRHYLPPLLLPLPLAASPTRDNEPPSTINEFYMLTDKFCLKFNCNHACAKGERDRRKRENRL